MKNFSLAPSGTPMRFAVFIGERNGSPASIKVYSHPMAPPTSLAREEGGGVGVPKDVDLVNIRPDGVGVGMGGLIAPSTTTSGTNGSATKPLGNVLLGPGAPCATKSFFRAERVVLRWNATGSHLLVLAQTEIDKSGKSYYEGESHVLLIAANGKFDCLVRLGKF